MASGGMYDLVGGGFARYSVDDRWLVPHFEKMLYDNAQLGRVYLFAHLLTGEDFYRRVCEKHRLDFVLRKLTHPLGGFYSSLDADSEGVEGKYYIWSLQEIQDILSDEQDRNLFIEAYGITENGNFEGQTVLQRAQTDKELAENFDLAVEDIPEKLDQIHQQVVGDSPATYSPIYG